MLAQHQNGTGLAAGSEFPSGPLTGFYQYPMDEFG
jgi:hypothetical protein